MAARSPNTPSERADVLDMVARLKLAAEARAAQQTAANAVELAAADELDFPAEFYQYFTVVKAA